MSLVADYASSSDSAEENEDGHVADGEEPKAKRMKLPAADFDAENDFHFAEEEEERSIPKNFGKTMANKPRGGKGKGSGGGKGKGAKGGYKKKEGFGPQGKGRTTSSGALDFDEDMTTKQRMQKRLTADPEKHETGVHHIKKTNAHGEVKQVITITKRPNAAPINHKNITFKDLFPKELSRC